MRFPSTSVSVVVLMGFSASRGVASSHLRARSQHQTQRSLVSSCPGLESFSVQFANACNYDNLRNAVNSIKGDCPTDANTLIQELLGVQNELDGKEAVKGLCADAYANTAETFPFANITNKGEEFDHEYYSGGTYLNYEIETDGGTNVLKEDASRVRRVYQDQAQHKVINFPYNIHAIDPDQDGCDLNAAFCCWVQDRQAGDNNGNCNTPYESQCIDKDPADNANFCYTDHSRSTPANHVEGGYSIFGNIQNNQENIEGPIHCHGLAWGEGGYDTSAVYRGNNLFYVSFFDHMYQRGYVRNAPGSAMCGCAENMAVVTRADCTEIQAHETFKFDYEAGSFSGVLLEVRDINFNACQGANNRNNDLEAYAHRLFLEGRLSEYKLIELRKILVGAAHGQCNQAIKDFMAEKNIYTTAGMASDGAIQPIGGGVEPIDITYEKASQGGDGNNMPEVPSDPTSMLEMVAPDIEAADPLDDAPEGATETFSPTPLPSEPPLKAAGGPCSDAWECMSGLCLGNGKCASVNYGNVGPTTGTICVAEGESCDNSTPCCNGTCSGNPKVCKANNGGQTA